MAVSCLALLTGEAQCWCFPFWLFVWRTTNDGPALLCSTTPNLLLAGTEGYCTGVYHYQRASIVRRYLSPWCRWVFILGLEVSHMLVLVQEARLIILFSRRYGSKLIFSRKNGSGCGTQQNINNSFRTASTVNKVFVGLKINPVKKNKSFDGQEAVQKGDRGPKRREVRKSGWLFICLKSSISFVATALHWLVQSWRRIVFFNAFFRKLVSFTCNIKDLSAPRCASYRFLKLKAGRGEQQFLRVWTATDNRWISQAENDHSIYIYRLGKTTWD